MLFLSHSKRPLCLEECFFFLIVRDPNVLKSAFSFSLLDTPNALKSAFFVFALVMSHDVHIVRKVGFGFGELFCFIGCWVLGFWSF